LRQPLRLIEANPAILFSRELPAENDALRRAFVGLMTAFHGILAGELARAKPAPFARISIRRMASCC
jgi:hypothetical protein